MIDALHELRDLLDAIEHDPEDQGAIDQAISIVERLITAHEAPLPTPAVGACYSVKTPVSRATAPPPPQPQPPQPQPKKSRRPKSQQFEIKRKSA